MIAYLNGTVDSVYEDQIIVDVNGVGFSVRVSDGYQFPGPGMKVKVYTYTYVKEDAFLLYGFVTREELSFFKLLITVNGIGPKGALAILGALSIDQLRFAIVGQDIKTIASAPGVGKKTAERLILDLKDKIDLNDTFSTTTPEAVSGSSMEGLDSIRRDAVEALSALGYGMGDAAKAVRELTLTEEDTVETVLKKALKFLL